MTVPDPAPALEELDGAATADALAETLRRIRAAEADQVMLAAHWVDLHAPELVAEALALLPGAETAVRSGAEGTPEMTEFAPAELAALLGMSTRAGSMLVADAVNLRHRHPLFWARLQAGTAPVWLGRKLARMCAAAGLSAEQARWVDAEATPYVTTLPVGRFLSLVEAKVIAADPAAAAERAEAEALRQFARAGRVDEHGMRTFVARALAGEVTYLVAVLDRIAGILALQGDSRPLEPRRAEALRILANPARALRLLTQATLDTLTDTPAGTPTGTPAGSAGSAGTLAGSAGEAGEAVLRGRLPERFSEYPQERPELVGTEAELVLWMRDATGRPLPGTPLRGDLVPLQDPTLALASAPVPAPLPDQTCPCGCRCEGRAGAGPWEEGLDPALLRSVLTALEGFDTTTLDPVTVLHLHADLHTLQADQGVVRVEGVGPMAATAARAWLADRPGPLTIRPVLDTREVTPVDRYEFTAAMKETIAARSPIEVFPYGTRASRGADHDHARPYDPAGPPGQTSLDNCAPLSRLHHRIKTFGRWTLRITEPGTYWWRTPHGHWYRVDHHGTHRHGRNTQLDEELLGPPE